MDFASCTRLELIPDLLLPLLKLCTIHVRKLSPVGTRSTMLFKPIEETSNRRPLAGHFKTYWATRNVSIYHTCCPELYEGSDRYPAEKRKTRAFVDLGVVGIPFLGAWIWEIVRVRNYDRSNPPKRPMDWSDDGFVAIFILFMMNWACLCSLIWPHFMSQRSRRSNGQVDTWLAVI